MKKEFHIRRNLRGSFVGKSLITLALVFAIIVTMPFLSNASELKSESAPSDSKVKCSLTVKSTVKDKNTGNGGNTGEDGDNTGSNNTGEDGDNTDSNNTETSDRWDIPDEFLVDLYLVADVKWYNNSDGYYYELCSPYNNKIKIDKDMTAEKWRTLSQQAAEIALADNNGDSPVKAGAKINEKIDVPAGLYLLIVRGTDPEEYITKNKDGDIVTQAYSGEYIYTFLPELVSIPSKAPDANGVINTANPGDWIYDMEVYLKPERSARYGNLKITKTLDRYNTSNGPTTFVFDIEAELNGKIVYSNVVSMVFDDSGTNELVVENIPVGAKVTVTEVYSGACYKLTSSEKLEVTISADLKDPATVSFENDYDERTNGGHGVTNHFTYKAEEGKDPNTDSGDGTNETVTTGEWKLEQIYDLPQREED